MPPISDSLKKLVAERAGHVCEYCKSPVNCSSSPFSIEHINPSVKGGETKPDNLAYSCQGCNGHKFTHSHGTDPLHLVPARLFHPRTDSWGEHFAWSEDFLTINGRTAIGRATIDRLRLNRLGLINLRWAMIARGSHPPKT